ncbi:MULTISPECIES: hypothetical protein [Xanthomonas]|uniref:hypothetical protein n=1 Tax=Xanthomonas TaxID=338 RepID=UPI000AC3DB0E|nr:MULTISPECIES: hypothetical protein [Xanthomonas]MBB4768661.1 hypothetical protein [Xanthomonas arboricola]
MLFFNILAWCGVFFFTLGWSATWWLVIAEGRKLRPQWFPIIGPIVCWGWLISGWCA